MNLEIPSLEKVKLIIITVVIVLVVSLIGGSIWYVNTLLNNKDKEISGLRSDLKTEVTNSALERANVATLRKELHEMSMANERLGSDLEIATEQYEKWKAMKPEIKYQSKIVKEIIRIPAEESDFCKAAKLFNEKVSELKYEEI